MTKIQLSGQLRNSFGLKLDDISKISSSSLIDVQKKSFEQFLFDDSITGTSILNVFKNMFPIHDNFGNASVSFLDYRIEYPKLTSEECRKKSLTYQVDIYIKIRLTLYDINPEDGSAEIKNIKEQEVFLCSMPHMTDNATFVVNGYERVVVSQIHRSPGVFFSRDIIDSAPVYSAGIIPYRGSWLSVYFDAKDFLYFKIDKKKKISIYNLLSALGISHTEMISYFYKPIKLSKDSSGNKYKILMDLDSIKKSYSPFDIQDENGEVIVSKSLMITGSVVRKMKKSESLFIKTEDLLNSHMYCDVKIDNKEFKVADPITESDLSMLESQKEGFSFEIIDSLDSKFLDNIQNAVISSRDVTYENALTNIFRVVNPGDIMSTNEAEKAFHDLFFSGDYYNLFPVGRHKMNLALGITDVPETHTTLRKEDILLVIKKLMSLKKEGAETDDIDNLSHRRVRSVGELLENQFRSGLLKVSKVIREKLSSGNLDSILPSDLVIGTPIGKAIRDFFLNSQLSQFMDHTNPLSELAHKRRISSLGAGGLTRDRAGIEVRDVHPTHYGRICPIETPEGQNIGLISSLSTYSVVNNYGFIESPYRKVVNKVLQDDVVFLDANKEYGNFICQFDKNVIKDGKINSEVVSARKDGDFMMTKSENISYIDVSPRQTISVVTSLIPFLANDDAKRALMGSNMQRQAVPLISTQAPLVGTGMESIVARDSGSIILAKRAGEVIYADSAKISIRVIKDGISVPEIDTYILRKFDRSNSATCINQKSLVKLGDKIDAGQVIADGAATDKGEMALGRNLTVAFLSFEGYNFEDSIAISENVIRDDAFTSIHIDSYEVVVRDTRLGAEESTRDIPSVSADCLKYLDESGIVQVGTHVKSGDIMVGKITPKAEVPITPEEKLLRAIFGHQSAEVKDSSLRVPPGVEGTIVDVSILTKRGTEKDSRAKLIEQEELLSAHESQQYQIEALQSFFLTKIVNELMGKEISYLTEGGSSRQVKLSTEELPEFTFQRAQHAEIKDEGSRKAVKSMLQEYNEAVQKLESDYQDKVKRIVEGDDLPVSVLKIIRVSIAIKSRLEPGDKMSGRHGNKGVVSKIVPVEDMPFTDDGKPVDMVLNPLGVPSRMNIGQILETNLGYVAKTLGDQIDEMLKKERAKEEIKKLLNNVLTDSEAKDKINSLDDKEFLEVAKSYRDGYPFAVPAFEGAKVSEIENMLEALGKDKSGQVTLYDGKTGEPFARKVTIGCMYMLKLHHLVGNKIHARSTGPYSLVTQQPLGGKSYFGGQRLGEMECWALEAYGAAYTLREMLTIKSDDIEGRNNAYESIIKNQTVYGSGIPESFNVLLKELRSLCFHVDIQ